MKKLLLSSIITGSLALIACSDTAPVAETAPVTASANTEKNVIVTDENFIRSDSNEQFAKYVKAFGAFSKFHHNRDSYDLNNPRISVASATPRNYDAKHIAS